MSRDFFDRENALNDEDEKSRRVEEHIQERWLLIVGIVGFLLPGVCPPIALFWSSKYRLPRVRSKLAFQLLNGVGPFDGFGRLVVVENEVLDAVLKLIQAREMIRLQEFALRQREPDLKLIEP